MQKKSKMIPTTDLYIHGFRRMARVTPPHTQRLKNGGRGPRGTGEEHSREHSSFGPALYIYQYQCLGAEGEAAWEAVPEAVRTVGYK